MSDVRLLLKEKADIETAMQRDLEPHIRTFAQQELDKVCKQIAREEWDKLFEQLETDQMLARVTELEASNKELLGALEYLLKQCEENERNNMNYMGVSEFAKERASKAIQKARGQEDEYQK